MLTARFASLDKSKNSKKTYTKKNRKVRRRITANRYWYICYKYVSVSSRFVNKNIANAIQSWPASRADLNKIVCCADSEGESISLRQGVTGRCCFPEKRAVAVPQGTFGAGSEHGNLMVNTRSRARRFRAVRNSAVNTAQSVSAQGVSAQFLKRLFFVLFI